MSGGTGMYAIEFPQIPTGNIYHFTTDHGIRYEVRFGRKENNLLHATIVFGVLNEEFEGEEYVITNKGDVYRVMATIAEIVKTYKSHHPGIDTFEFSGEPKNETSGDQPTTRTRFYMRYLDDIFGEGWTSRTEGNKVIISKNQG